MRKLIKILLILIIIAIVGGYFAGTYFARSKADQEVAHLVEALKQDPSIQSITYEKVQSDLLDFLQHVVIVKGIEVILTDAPENPISIDTIKVSNLELTKSQVPLSFNVSAEKIHFNELSEVLMLASHHFGHPYPGSPVIIHLNAPAVVAIYQDDKLLYQRQLPAGKHDVNTTNFPVGTYQVKVVTQPLKGLADSHKQLFTKPKQVTAIDSVITQLPKGPLLYANLDANYDVNKSEFGIGVTLSTAHQNVMNYDLLLHPVRFKRPITNLDRMLQPLEMAYVESANSSMQYQNMLHLSDLPKSPLTLLLEELGYQQLDVNFESTSQVTSRTSNNSGQITIVKAGSVNWQLKNDLGKHRPLGLILHSMNTEHDAIKNSYVPSIQAFALTYTDHGLLNNVMDMLAKRSNQPSSDIRNMVSAFLKQMIAETQVERLKHALEAVERFVENPGAITVTLSPDKPFKPTVLNEYAELKQKQDAALKKSLSLIPDNPAGKAQKAQIYEAYTQQTDKAAKQFLDRIGFSVTTR